MTDRGTMVVNFGALESAGQSIQTALSTLHARLEEVDKMGKRLSAGWTGDSQQAYQVRQAGWQRAADDLGLMLKEIQVAITNAKQRYLDTERKNTGYFPT
jgi:WXG100 family type VII secretion target